MGFNIYVLFASLNGEVFYQKQLHLEPDSGSILHMREELMVTTSGLLSNARNINLHWDVSPLKTNKPNESWFDQSEKEATMADFDDLNDGFLLPRSLLKVIDEGLEYELCREEDRVVEEEEGMVELERMSGNSVSDKEDDDMEELAMKCYESDIDINMPIKHLWGLKKKKDTVVLERTTRSNKPY